MHYQFEARARGHYTDALSLEDDEGPLEQHSISEKALYDLELKVKQQLHAYKNGLSTPEHSAGVKLSRINVYAFDGNILYWYIFWEQFVLSVHSKTQLSHPKKLTYLKHAVKIGRARQVIEGLLQSANNFFQALKCLPK